MKFTACFFVDLNSNLFARSVFYRFMLLWSPVIIFLHQMAVVVICFIGLAGSAAVVAGTWTTGWPVDGPSSVYTLVADSSGNVYAGTNHGVYKTSSAGIDWVAVNNGVPASQVTALTITPSNGIFAAVSGGAVFTSSNGGTSWTDISLSNNSYNLVSFLALTSDSSGNIFAAYSSRWGTSSFGSSISKLLIESNTWSRSFIPPGNGMSTFSDPHTLLSDGQGNIYAGMEYRELYPDVPIGRIYKTSNGGVDWVQVNVGTLPPVKSLMSIPSGMLVAGTTSGAVYTSNDGGVNWASASNGLPSKAINALAIDANSTFYAGTAGAGVFMSTDGGSTWTAMNNGLSSSAVIQSLATDRAGRLYAAADGSVYQFGVDLSPSSLRVVVVGASRAAIGSTTGHGGYGSYELDVTPGGQVRLSASLRADNQLFSHWVGCDSNPSADTHYFNGCDISMPASGGKRVTAVYTSPASKLVNISTRANVLTGDNVLIAGFVISGGPKWVLIKAAGPSMANLNPPVFNTLSNPMLTLFSGSTPIANNDDWERASNAAAVQASGIAPTHSREAALLTMLNPGAYTVIVQGVSGGTGIGLVSVDDLDPFDSASRLINISSRAYTSTGGDDQLIAGFILQGEPKDLFMAGAGPSMAKYGVPGVLADPVSTLYSGQVILGSNDNWRESAETSTIDIRTVGDMFTKESALVRVLQPGAYTIIMRGNGMPGIGLISVEE